MLLEHNTRPHIRAATSPAIHSTGSEVVPHLSTAWMWHRVTSGCLHLSSNISKEVISRKIKKFTLTWFLRTARGALQ